LAVILRKIGVSDCTYYRWRQEYGGIKVEPVKRLNELGQENSASSAFWPTSLWIT